MDFAPVTWFESLPSTNACLREQLDTDPSLAGGTLIAAREQTAGQGQHGRQWISCPGRDLTFSFLLRSRVNLAWVPSLPMAAALAIRSTLADYGLTARVKWPNDVYVNGRKISGILAQNVPGHNETVMVVGVGLNVNMSETDAAIIGRPATSIAMETGRTVSVDDVLSRLLPSLSQWIDRWQEGGFQAIRSDWIAATFGLGGKARVTRCDGDICGVLEDFGENGELVLVEEDGQRRLVWTGDLLVNGSA